jgi:gliding motility-associated-like protein
MNGCDSVVFVDLIFLDEVSNTIAPQLCPGESLLINGNLYDENNPVGTEVMSNAAASGCDSTIFVDLHFYDIAIGTLTPTTCAGDTLYINGNAYHENNSSGIEVFENASFRGCDSIVQVELDMIASSVSSLDMTLCSGDTIFVNGNAYYQNNTTGTEVLENASYQGCDSTVQVNISFFVSAEGSFQTTICSGDTIFYNGQSYYEDNPNGIILLENASANGCDSLISVEVSFYEIAQDTFATTLCAEEIININGTIYDQNNSSGTEIFQTENGCDSILSINISFLNAVRFDTLASICAGEEFLLADRSFSEPGSYEIELENAAVAGCDSIIQITLSVLTSEDLGPAELGEDIIQCERSINLIANQPLGTTGLWTSLDGMNISNPHDNTLDINNLSPGWNTFLWTLSSAQCANYDSDTIRVFTANSPQANNDNYNLSIEQQAIDFDLFENDNLSTVDAYTFELLSTPSNGQLTEMAEGLYQYEREGIREDLLQFNYQLCNEDCPDLCDTASVRITIAEQDIDLFDIPNTITPNDDGVNEFFMFPHLEYNPDQYPDKELIIFNRWGDIVYEAQPYQNNWHGQDKSGKFLPQGTYYYVFRLDINQGIILKGDVSIIK